MNAFPEASALLAVPLYLLVAYFGLALSHMGSYRANSCLDRLDWRFFYRRIHLACFKKERASVFFAILIAAETLRFVGFVSCIIWLSHWQMLPRLQALILLAALFLFSWIGDFLPRFLATRYPKGDLKLAAFITSCTLTLLLPFQWALLKAFGHLGSASPKSSNRGEATMKERVLDILHETDGATNSDWPNKKILRGVLNYHERVSKEIMVPRVRVFCLPAHTTIRVAAEKILSEGYTRIPVYREHIDHILGLLMTRDLFQVLATALFHPENRPILDRPIETLVKPVLFAPEGKPVAQLMQEFRKKKVHLAIVVDEYGGTEGIVTIEDILEEIVGDIRDEYDETSPFFAPQSDGSYLLDARTSILDVEEHLGIKVPQHKDYDSLSGYAFHRAGKIPEPGFSIHHDDFDLEVVASSERRVEKVRISPTANFEIPPAT